MLFNLFGKKDSDADNHVFTDRAYVSEAAKLKACADLAKKEPNHIFICWFPETASKFKDYFAQQGLSTEIIIEARHIHTSKIEDKLPVFAEHYPLHEKEIDLIKNWPGEKIMVFSSLDEPLFKHFGSDKIIPFIKMLGMKEDEAIEHTMVSKSIITGQEKIAKMVTLEQYAASQEEWMLKNVK